MAEAMECDPLGPQACNGFDLKIPQLDITTLVFQISSEVGLRFANP